MPAKERKVCATSLHSHFVSLHYHRCHCTLRTLAASFLSSPLPISISHSLPLSLSHSPSPSLSLSLCSNSFLPCSWHVSLCVCAPLNLCASDRARNGLILLPVDVTSDHSLIHRLDHSFNFALPGRCVLKKKRHNKRSNTHLGTRKRPTIASPFAGCITSPDVVQSTVYSFDCSFFLLASLSHSLCSNAPYIITLFSLPSTESTFFFFFSFFTHAALALQFAFAVLSFCDSDGERKKAEKAGAKVSLKQGTERTSDINWKYEHLELLEMNRGKEEKGEKEREREREREREKR